MDHFRRNGVDRAQEDQSAARKQHGAQMRKHDIPRIAARLAFKGQSLTADVAAGRELGANLIYRHNYPQTWLTVY
jgi:hypothetical protein